MAEKKTRTPKSPEAITAGALALPLADRVALCKKLKEAIQAEVKLSEIQAKAAADLTKDL
jgi:hypothetical protein